MRDGLRNKSIWVKGANRYRNPDEDLPSDFESQRTTYYQTLSLPQEGETFISLLQQQMREALQMLDGNLPNNPKVWLTDKGRDKIHITPLTKQPEPRNLSALKTEITRQWPMTSLLDVLKETDLRVGFTDHLTNIGERAVLPRHVLQKRLLLCLYGLGTNMGIKRVSNAIDTQGSGEQYTDLQYVYQRYLTPDTLRMAIAMVVNETLRIRQPHIWGEGTTAVASDARKFAAREMNLLTEWHVRYHGPGVMVYWHVERHSTCIYSQLKSCSSSEVAAMIEGVLRHCTEMEVEKNYVDSHGQSEVGFAFCHLLGFKLLPRLKAISRQRLYRPDKGDPFAYPNLMPILTRPINWRLILSKLAKQLAKRLRREYPDYTYLKKLFYYLRAELDVEVPLKTKKFPVVPTEEEIQRFYAVVWQSNRFQDILIIKTFLYTGVRVSELCHIRLSDVDAKLCQIRIHRGKGNKDRLVVFPSSFREALAMHIKSMEEKQGSYLFESSWKRKYSERGIRQMLRRYAELASLSQCISPHKLRHFLLLWLKKQGIDDAFIQPYSGHAHRQSLEIYSRLAISEAQQQYDQVIARFPV